MKRHATEILAGIAFLCAVGLTIHQHFACNTGGWFEWFQLWHYEPFVLAALVAAIALLIGKYLGKRGF